MASENSTWHRARVDLLTNLLAVATKTGAADVWRAMFAEMLKTERELASKACADEAREDDALAASLGIVPNNDPRKCGTWKGVD